MFREFFTGGKLLSFYGGHLPMCSFRSRPIQSNHLRLIWIQGLKWVPPALARIAFWLSCFGLNCAQMAPEGAESDFGLQLWIGTLRLKQIFLIFSARWWSYFIIISSCDEILVLQNGVAHVWLKIVIFLCTPSCKNVVSEKFSKGMWIM